MGKGKRKITEGWGAAFRPHPMNVAMSLGLVLILEFYIMSQFALRIFPYEGATYMKARLIVGLMLFVPLWIICYGIISLLTYQRK